MTGPRELFEEHMKTLGLVAFENKLKDDTVQTIEDLHRANVEPKMITGDNIYIAVETGMRSRIIEKDEKVILLQGSKQDQREPILGKRIFNGICLY